MRRSRTFSTAVAGAAGLALAAGFLTSADAAEKKDPILITQMARDDISDVLGSALACAGGGQVRENQFYRRFDPPTELDAEDGVQIQEISFGVSELTTTDGIPVSVHVFAIDPADPLLVANLEDVATADGSIPTDANDTVVSTEIDGTVPAGKDLVIGMSVAEQPVGNLFRLGSNDDFETTPAFLRAPDCGATEPTDTDTLGFPDSHLVLFARGKAGECVTAEADLDQAEADLATATDLVAQAKASRKKANRKLTIARKKFQRLKQNNRFGAPKVQRAKRKVERLKKKKQERFVTAHEGRKAERQAQIVVFKDARALVALECKQLALPSDPGPVTAPPAPAAPAAPSNGNSFSSQR